MFRVSYNSEISREWYSRSGELPSPKKRRIYRWGTHWGILDEKWSCEKRIPLESTDTMLVESCTPTIALPPKDIDDLWEEEYCSIKGLEYNGLVFLKGSREEVLEMTRIHGLPTPLLPQPQQPQAQLQPPKPAKPAKHHKSVCLIQD